jgi:hypothetical protein
MAFLTNRVWLWRFKGTAGDRRLGFVEMGDAAARNEIVGGRGQDPMVGLYALKHLDYTVAGGMRARAPGPPAPSKGEEPDDGATPPAFLRRPRPRD